MELPHLGKHCSQSTCKQLDFLPVKCDACEKVFCKEHVLYHNHNCDASYKKDVQVPVCPLCNQPIPVNRGEQPDIKVGEHIDRDCQSDPAKEKRKIFTNKCSLKGCKQKEMIKVLCSTCQKNYCLKHRHPQDHDCNGLNTNKHGPSRAGVAALARAKTFQNGESAVNSRNNWPSYQPSEQAPGRVAIVQGNLSEDEALARAIQLSLLDSSNQASSTDLTKFNQEEEDRKLAEALAASEREGQQQRPQDSQPVKDRCAIA